MNAPAATTLPDFRARLAAGGAQAVVFVLGGELYGCDIRVVEEVVTKQRIHPLPDVPPYVLGVLSLRGELVPVMDVAPVLGMVLGREKAPSLLVCTLGEGRLGVPVEAVREVMEVPADALRPAPHTGGDRDAYVVGVARLEAGLVTLMDLAELLRERTTLDNAEQP